jgi:hypothetical protein
MELTLNAQERPTTGRTLREDEERPRAFDELRLPRDATKANCGATRNALDSANSGRETSERCVNACFREAA